MPNTKQIHTVPDSDGNGWLNVSDGRTMSSHRTKETAVSRGRKLARQEKAEHVIHNRDGRIARSNSYGGDPFPPRG